MRGLLYLFFHLRLALKTLFGRVEEQEQSWGGRLYGADPAGKLFPFYQFYKRKKEWKFCAYLSKGLEKKVFKMTMLNSLRSLIYFQFLALLVLFHLGGRGVLLQQNRRTMRHLANVKPVRLCKKYIITLARVPESLAGAKRCMCSAERFGESEDMEIFSGIGRSEAQEFFQQRGLVFSSTPDREKDFDVQSQMGCFASHYLLWEQCVRLNEPVMILEDDCEFHAAVPALRFREIVFLGKFCANWEQKLMAAIPGREKEAFYPFYRMRGTYAYGITPAGAAGLLKAAQKMIVQPVDLFMNIETTHIVACRSQPMMSDPEISSILKSGNLQILMGR